MSGPVTLNLNDECEDCGVSRDEVDEVLPVMKGRWSVGPEWYCGGCIDE